MTRTSASPAPPAINFQPPINLRLSLTNNNYNPRADVIGATTLYWTTAIVGGLGVVTGYNGSRLARKTIAQKSLALGTLTSDKNYNIYYDYDGDALALGAAWTNDTTPSETVVDVQGAPVLTSDHTKLYLGVLRTTSTTTTEDSGGGTTTKVGGKRFLWNCWNQLPTWLRVIDTTDQWTYGTDTWRVADGGTAPTNCVEWITGGPGTMIRANVIANISVGGTGTTVVAKAGVGIDASTPSGIVGSAADFISTAIVVPISASYRGFPGLGYHYAAWLEKGPNGSTSIFLGDSGGDGSQSGLEVDLLN